MTQDMLHVMEWHNGEKPRFAFSDHEMGRRQDGVRQWMAANDVDAALFTSSQSVAYFSGWFYNGFQQKCGMVVSATAATTISPAVEGGQPWRQGFHDNISYTDWRRDNFFYALRQLTPRVGRLAIELDHVTVKFLRQLESALPGVEFVDIGQASMRMRSIKSAAEHDLLRAGARIAAQSATLGLTVPEALEYEVAIAGLAAMHRGVAATIPGAGMMGCDVLFQSGIHTDGAQNPITDKRIQSGDVLSLTCVAHVFFAGPDARSAMGRRRGDELDYLLPGRSIRERLDLALYKELEICGPAAVVTSRTGGSAVGSGLSTRGHIDSLDARNASRAENYLGQFFAYCSVPGLTRKTRLINANHNLPLKKAKSIGNSI